MSDILERQAALRAFWSAADALSDGSPPALYETSDRGTTEDEHDAAEPSSEAEQDDSERPVCGTGSETVDNGDDEVGTDGVGEEVDEGTPDGPTEPSEQSGDSDVEPHSSERVHSEDSESDEPDFETAFEPIHHACGYF